MLAVAVDLGITTVVIFSLSYAVGSILAGLQVGRGRIIAVGNLIGLLIFWLYWALFESSRYQATPGKLLLGSVVTNLAAGRIGFRQASLRNLAKVLSVVLLYGGFILAAFTGKKQALHDLLTGCLVIQKPGRRKTQRRKRRSRTKKLTK